jgi:hypothetical protein
MRIRSTTKVDRLLLALTLALVVVTCAATLGTHPHRAPRTEEAAR